MRWREVLTTITFDSYNTKPIFRIPEMFHFTPASTLHSYLPPTGSDAIRRSAHPINPRERYLAAIAEAKSAEAEYLAAEVARQEVALRRQRDEYRGSDLLGRSPYDFTPSYDPRVSTISSRAPLSYGDYPEERPVFESDRMSLLRRQLVDEELVRVAVARRQQEEHDRQILRRRQQAEDAYIALAVKHQEEQEQKRVLLRRRQQEQRTHAAALQRAQQVKLHQQSELLNLQETLGRFFAHPSEQQNPTKHCCESHSNSRHTEDGSVEQFLQALVQGRFEPAGRAKGEQCLRNCHPRTRLHRNVLNSHFEAQTGVERINQQSSHTEATSTPSEVEQLLNLLLKGRSGVSEEERQVLRLPSRSKPEGLGEILNTLFGGQPQAVGNKQEGSPITQSKPNAPHSEGEVELQQVMDLIFGGKSEDFANKTQQVPKASTSQPIASTGGSKGVEHRSSPDITSQPGAGVDKEGQQKCHFTSKPNTTARPCSDTCKAPSPGTSSLKEQLEARLGNEYAIEVRDTIQAILASLTEPSFIPADTQAQSVAVNDKGKEKAEGTSKVNAPTSKDVVESMDEVRNIEAAFYALESDFIFPTQLDFTPRPSPSASPVSSDSESSTSRLAYTARNQPVRFYEQALSTLLAKLDSVDSFGNESLRGRRKEVVDRVEKALEELERGIEGQWKFRQGKENRVDLEESPKASTQAVKSVPAEPATSSIAIPEGPAVPSAGASTPIPVNSAPAPVSEISVSDSGRDSDNPDSGPSSESPVSPQFPESMVSNQVSTPSNPDSHSSSPNEVSDTKDEFLTDSAIALDGVVTAPELLAGMAEEVFEQQKLPSSTHEVVTVVESSSYSPTSSFATIRPTAQEIEPIDTFLLPDTDPAPFKSNIKATQDAIVTGGDTDAGSDWSEVEA